MAFLITYPKYQSGGISLIATGHATVAMLNGRTGEFRAFNFSMDTGGPPCLDRN
jgi:hypothetical protein